MTTIESRCQFGEPIYSMITAITSSCATERDIVKEMNEGFRAAEMLAYIGAFEY